jgi:hypothetical protein
MNGNIVWRGMSRMNYPQRQPDKGVDNIGITGNSFHASSTSWLWRNFEQVAVGLRHGVKL